MKLCPQAARLAAVCATAAFLASLMPYSGAAQQPAQSQDDQLREFRLVRRVDRVTTPLVVRDRDGEYIDDLMRTEIKIYDNGEAQTLTNFEYSEQPVTVVIVFDTSQRVKPLLKRVRKSAYVFTEAIIGPLGEGAVISFDDEVRILQDFTPNSDKILDTVKGLKAGGTMTRLADALHLAVERLLTRPRGRRRVIVVISEERDEGSETALGEALRLAQLGEISVYAVSLSKVQADWLRDPQETSTGGSPYPPGVSVTPPIPGALETPSLSQQGQTRANLGATVEALIRAGSSKLKDTLLEIYSSGTAGVKYEPGSQASLDNALYDIGQDLRSQYLLTYRPTNGRKQGFHEIRVKVTRKRAQVRYRPGYFIGLPPES